VIRHPRARSQPDASDRIAAELQANQRDPSGKPPPASTQPTLAEFLESRGTAIADDVLLIDEVHMVALRLTQGERWIESHDARRAGSEGTLTDERAVPFWFC
jgi:hypothetical protein